VKHALLVPFAELLPDVEGWLEQPEGIPPHVTVLFPAPPSIADALDGVEAFDVVFRKTGRFEDAVWLAPEPAERFVELTKRVWRRFPDWPPYGGEFLPEITPHLTVAWGAHLDEAEEAIGPRLPLHSRAREALLVAEVEPRRWETQSIFAFV
jgi:hypothetical protein